MRSAWTPVPCEQRSVSTGLVAIGRTEESTEDHGFRPSGARRRECGPGSPVPGSNPPRWSADRTTAPSAHREQDSGGGLESSSVQEAARSPRQDARHGLVMGWSHSNGGLVGSLSPDQGGLRAEQPRQRSAVPEPWRLAPLLLCAAAGRRPGRLLPIALAEPLIFAIKLVQAFEDPVIGWRSDRTRSRLGRRVPFVLAGLPIAGSPSSLPPSPRTSSTTTPSARGCAARGSTTAPRTSFSR